MTMHCLEAGPPHESQVKSVHCNDCSWPLPAQARHTFVRHIVQDISNSRRPSWP